MQSLVSILPAVSNRSEFALKGGTAINLFVRNLPRLSVDIDLTYLQKGDRAASLHGINQAMKALQSELQSMGFSVNPNTSKEGTITRLLVRNSQAQVKIETTPVLRETVHPVITKTVTPDVEAEIGFAEMQVLDFDELYAGKICAALDRQHPRDLFDIKLLLENEGISERLKNTFLAYLISHSRPIAELLQPNKKPLDEVFIKEIELMTELPVSIEELENIREELINLINSLLSDYNKDFLSSIKRGNPDWSRFYFPQVETMPAVAWKIQNLDQMSSAARLSALQKLEQTLSSANSEI